ncbi:MAG TPA: radical SAM protein [Fermentimonas caenicola]|jgi:7-carboxy-7-deazaguanine synthase|uniref:7-carboxy-7-deazaguanine synthase QueE n=1 Tax=Lascolabacillus TaxID=1924067 RepID=UPI0006B377A2|nr:MULTISPECIES: 7-carboxy-7-deazaguanine synthase QueE [Lascolabacillus]MBP6176050.1 radical SAM protein [Fermentimonas sp.]MDI9625344.1 7-carboxy-7-deazaguanine synthase QueE [Bacteroidota bacterium]HHU42271.1 radical SAM protein [Fermentimonas caenicola]MBP6196223.1 radical SAM protein [Fermentimonas sp.]MCK9501195.1 7-carboxy-7-deazaguanine synthase QueE [Lascolabacillus sp.]
MNLNVNEIFYSLQGEGGRTGQASIFIRLAKCNLACSFCDTDFERGVKMSLEEVFKEIEKYNCKWIIWTGGEPALQLNDKIVAFFKERGYLQAIETNGTKRIPSGIDYITCSPKQNFEIVKELIPEVDELRFPIQKGDPLPDISILPKTNRYLLSPIFDNDKVIQENVDYCISLIKDNPVWALSLQTHKLIGIR